MYTVVFADSTPPMTFDNTKWGMEDIAKQLAHFALMMSGEKIVLLLNGHVIDENFHLKVNEAWEETCQRMY